MAVDLSRTKADLQAQAERLGVSSSGTKAEIAARITARTAAVQQAQRGRCPHCKFRSRHDFVLAAHKRQAHRKEY